MVRVTQFQPQDVRAWFELECGFGLAITEVRVIAVLRNRWLAGDSSFEKPAMRDITGQGGHHSVMCPPRWRNATR